MCILIMKIAGEEITKKRLKTCFENNDDGAGFAYVNTDYLGHRKVITYKSMDFKPFYKKLRRAERNNPESNFLIHFRIATSGVLSTYNCHPFQVNKDIVMGHNGIITAARKDPENLKNDTQMFVEDTVKALPKDFMGNEAICDMMGSYIGMSKLVFLDVNNRFTIVNEGKGDWVEGVWYSNSSYKPRTWGYSKTYTTTTYTPPKKSQKKITDSSFIECDYCGTFTRVGLLKPYRSFGYIEALCDKCEAKLLESGSIIEEELETTVDFIKSYNSDAGQQARETMTS